MLPSLYFEMDELKKLINTTHANKQLSILSINVQSIQAKFRELEVVIENLQTIDFKFNIVCLQECWLSEQTDYKCVQLGPLPGYDCVAQGGSSSTSGGLITYVDQSFQHDIISNINQHTLWEGLVLRIKGGGLTKGIIIGNIYTPPRMLKDEIKQFINELHYLYYPLKNIDSI